MTKPASGDTATQYSAQHSAAVAGRSYTPYSDYSSRRTDRQGATTYGSDTYMSEESDYSVGTKTGGTADKKPAARAENRCVRRNSIVSVEIQTAEDLSLQKTDSIKSGDGVVTADDMSRRSSDTIRTESGAGAGEERAGSPGSKSESIHEGSFVTCGILRLAAYIERGKLALVQMTIA